MIEDCPCADSAPVSDSEAKAEMTAAPGLTELKSKRSTVKEAKWADDEPADPGADGEAPPEK